MNKKLTIAHIVCTFPPYKGGMGNVAFEQVKRLSKKHEVTVFALAFTGKPKDKPGFGYPKPGLSFGSSFQIIRLKPWLKVGNGGFCPQILFRLKKFDIIQLHYPFFGAQEILWLAKILGLLKNKKIIIFYHMDAVLKNGLLKLLSLPSKLIRNSLFKKCDKVICASVDYVKHSKIKNIYAKYSDKFTEIPFGSKFFKDKPGFGYPKPGLSLKNQPQDKIILFVGGLDSAHNFKGVDILINAFSKLIHETRNSSYKLTIVGDGDLRPQYEKQVKKLNLQKQIIFTGAPTDQELPSYYQICDIFVLPSINQAEAFGLVIIEAKTFGKAVIGSDLPGVRDVVGDQISGLTIKPGDIDDLCVKLKKLLEDDNLRNQFGQAGLKQVKEKYNWDRHVKNLEQLYGHVQNL